MIVEDQRKHDFFATPRSDDPYRAAVCTWLQGKTPGTIRSYRSTLRGFLEFTGLHPAEVTTGDLVQWKEELRYQGLADSTIAQRLSALSSYYSHLVTTWIHRENPVDNVDRGDLDVSPYHRASSVELEAFRRILDVIPFETEMGARDRAALLFYVLCARRRSEVVNLRASDLRVEGERVTYMTKLDSGEIVEKELPPPVWEAIQHYLELSGRTPTGNDPVFTATSDAGKYLRDYYGSPEPDQETPLSGESMRQGLKRYAADAGVDPDTVSLRSLRHLGARLFYDASSDPEETRQFLDHGRLDTTRLCLKELTGGEHRHWREMADRLGVDW